MSVILRMKKRLKKELDDRGMLPADLEVVSGISAPTIRHYMSPYLPGGKLEVWLMLSEALGHGGLDWLMCEGGMSDEQDRKACPDLQEPQ